MSDPSVLPRPLASPFTLLLDEIARPDSGAREVLLLSYTLDLTYFERTALGAAQALGARVTVVGDAHVVTHDLRDVRRAGRSYVAGLGACARAFHPKLAVIVGDERATVAIGSGNLTLAGWQHNEELWTVIRADSEHCPATLHQVASWLRRISGPVRFSHAVTDALVRVAERLEALPVTEDGPRLVSTLEGRIIEQLPPGGVDELSVYAPFHDPGAAALRALIDRFNPSRVTLGVQPELTTLDGPAVEGCIAGVDAVEVIELDETRYRHGKLIEGATGGRRWALTGSPNCSTSALLRSLAEGGNCELGLVALTAETLMPAGTDMPRVSLRAKAYTPRATPGPAIVLLGAVRTAEGLQVLLARPCEIDGYVELSGAGAAPEVWERIQRIGAGEDSVSIARGVEGGARVRVVAVDDGRAVRSNVVYVLDPERALRRPARAGEVRPTTEAFDLFEDVHLAERFVTDLGGLRSGLPGSGSARVAAASVGTTAERRLAYTAWDDYLEQCAGRIGHSLLNFALGLPAITGDGPGLAFQSFEWDEALEDAPGALDGESDVEAATEADPSVALSIPDVSAQPAAVRRRYRQWAARLAEMAPGLGAPERLLAARLVLWTAAAGAWDGSEWVGPLAEATRALAVDEVPSVIEGPTASLAAVLTAVLRSAAPRSRGSEESRVFKKTARAVAHLLAAAEPSYVEEYGRLLRPVFGPWVDVDTVEEVASEVVQADAVADAVTALVDELGYREAHRHGQVIHVPGRFSNPLLPALEAAGMAGEEQSPVGAWAGDAGTWRLVVWTRPHLVVFGDDRSVRWAVYRLSGLTTPLVCAHERLIDPRFRLSQAFGSNSALAEEARSALDAVGLSTAEPPVCV